MSFCGKNKFFNRFVINSEGNINSNKDNFYSMKKGIISMAIENEKLNQQLINKNIIKNSPKRIITRNVTIDDNKSNKINQYKMRIYSKKAKEEEKNYSINKKLIDINTSFFFNKKLRQSKIKINLNSTENFFKRSDNKVYTQKKIIPLNKNKTENEHLNKSKKKIFKRLNSLIPRKNYIQQKNTEKKIHKKYLFSRLKDLLDELEKEKESKESKNKSPKKLKDMSYLFLERSVKPQIPNLKNRIQLNKYIINDFKENESYQDYIKRSLKYRKINENYEEALMLQKETNKFFTLSEFNSPESDNENEKNSNKLKRKSLLNNTILPRRKSNINILTPNMIQGILVLKNKKSEKNLKKKTSNKNLSSFATPIIRDYKDKLYQNKRNSINRYYNVHFNLEEKPKSNNNDSFLQDQFVEENPKKYFRKKKTEIFSSEKAMLIKARSVFPLRNKKHTHIPKKRKRKMIFDKFAISNNIYNEQKKYFDDYLMNKRITRSKNFSEQMSNLAKEKDLYRNNGDDTGSLPKLKEGSLIYEMKIKNLFKNSFNPMANFKEGDEDLDLDNLKKIKNSVMEMEIEMFTSLKDEINPKYIRNKFNKTTVGKYHSTRGVYFGSK